MPALKEGDTSQGKWQPLAAGERKDRDSDLEPLGRVISAR